MQPYMKITIAVVAIALIVVLGMILLVRQPGGEGTPGGMPQQTAVPQESPMPQETGLPEDDEPEDPAQPMYEGALAGLSEEEIAALAMAEENAGSKDEEDRPEGNMD